MIGEKGKGLRNNNPYKEIDIGCVFKDFEIRFINTSPDRSKEFCPYGDHKILIEDPWDSSCFKVRMDYVRISYLPETPMLIIDEQKCRECKNPITMTVLPLPPYKVWTRENWEKFYLELLGLDFRVGNKFESLRSYIWMGFPFKSLDDVFEDMNKWLLEAEERLAEKD